MGVFLAAILVFGLAVVGLALGVLLGRKPLRGSCGRGGGDDCEDDGISCEACPNRKAGDGRR
jgi:hypothetical protein